MHHGKRIAIALVLLNCQHESRERLDSFLAFARYLYSWDFEALCFVPLYLTLCFHVNISQSFGLDRVLFDTNLLMTA